MPKVMIEAAYKSGLSTAVHDKADVQDYFALVYDAVQRHWSKHFRKTRA